LKYYLNLTKIVGKERCFILGANQPETRDLLIEKINLEIDIVKKNIQLRNTLMQTNEEDNHVDVEIVCTEWQGEKMVYIMEVRVPGMATHRLFKRYKYMEDCY